MLRYGQLRGVLGTHDLELGRMHGDGGRGGFRRRSVAHHGFDLRRAFTKADEIHGCPIRIERHTHGRAEIVLIEPMEAIEKASGKYGRFDEAVKKIDPREE